MYIAKETIHTAIMSLRGTANHLLKIWLVLKLMGLDDHTPVSIDTGNSTPYLKRLFGCGAPDGALYVPFAHTARFAFMKSDASRSIIQTTLQRWATSGSVVTCDPSSFLKISNTEDNKLIVKTGRQYPLGLGNGKNGFALDDGQRVRIPAEYFAIWLFAREDIENKNASELVKSMMDLLHLTAAEYKTIFVETPVNLQYQHEAISDAELFLMCQHAFDESPNIEEAIESTDEYIRRVKNMVTISERPTWVQTAPEIQLKNLMENGEKAILLYGPPRTGKTRAIDNIIGRNNEERISIQLHEGWGYENLVLGMFPAKEAGAFEWKKGALLSAIQDGKRYIVLEEINRTNASQALGELFSLIEAAYRGEENSIVLPNGEKIYVPRETVIFMTMNTIDASTEDIDDALIGRMASVYFPPRIEDLDSILLANGVDTENAEKVKEVFNAIQSSYPLGHGYFANYKGDRDFRLYYLSRIRPVLANHFDSYKPEVLFQIDNAVDSLF
jgi:5-methylcytosine-specific restriction protein B